MCLPMSRTYPTTVASVSSGTCFRGTGADAPRDPQRSLRTGVFGLRHAHQLGNTEAQGFVAKFTGHMGIVDHSRKHRHDAPITKAQRGGALAIGANCGLAQPPEIFERDITILPDTLVL